jgi:beta-ureidopropionase / N-carbamoyl-L-amino-acid hydrolase
MLAELAEIGADPTGGVTRLAYSPADLEARSWFIDQARKLDLEVSIDPVGNILAVEPNLGPGPPLLSGSHLDTVPSGGRFDGMLGVTAALAAINAIRTRAEVGDRSPAERRPLGVLVLATEESSRFGAGCIGSRSIVRDLRAEDLKTLTDAQGVTLFEALQDAGLAPERLSEAGRAPGWFHQFVEVHIDQAEDLFQAGVPLGIITAIAAPTRLWLRIQGRQAHSGSTPMNVRHDALAGAAEIILAVEAAARARIDQDLVGTVGIIRVQPGSMNTVPGLVELGVDIRGIGETIIEDAVREVTQAARRAAEARGLTVNISVLWRSRPVQIAAESVDALERACREVGASTVRMISRSAHDALYLGQHGPVSMLFVRNPAGISHNPDEDAWDEDIILGASALATYLAWAARRGN